MEDLQDSNTPSIVSLENKSTETLETNTAPLSSILLSLFPNPNAPQSAPLTLLKDKNFSIVPDLILHSDSRYGRSKNPLGFLLGSALTLKNPIDLREPVPWALQVGPKFGFVFNPEDVHMTHFAITGEVGGMVSDTFVTGYLGFGPEIDLLSRFSMEFMPCYVFPPLAWDVDRSQEMDSASDEPSGGFGLIMKVNLYL